MSILVTGGAGYIGSHACVELLNAGCEVVVVDNLYNSKEESLNRVQKITGKTLKFYECDIRDAEGLEKVFTENKIECVIHFAGLKAVGESCKIPLEYYDNNIGGTVILCQVMAKMGVKKLVFSSSATVYGDSPIPYREDMHVGHCTNPYGRTKYMIEEILRDLYASDNEWSIALLRYFNPIGAHESGLIGEDPNGIPNNLLPYISQVAIGKLACLSVFGDDYNTPDGTGVRDYIHVTDLAIGHVKAVKYLESRTGIDAINLGAGRGYSVLELVKAFEKACGHEIAYKIAPRRPGDLDVSYADPQKAKDLLGFETQLDVDKMCEDTWRWQSNNPNGYDK
ncbi:MAG: UDP-glucose 4-epimerase GalE [Clostridia bacterium]|nr:UDP-glucose 4-epimerase GalE [Clostridia bacterium]